MGWTFRGSNPSGGEIFRTLGPTQPTVQRVPGLSFPAVKHPGRGTDLPPSSSAQVKERVELPIPPLGLHDFSWLNFFLGGGGVTSSKHTII